MTVLEEVRRAAEHPATMSFVFPVRHRPNFAVTKYLRGHGWFVSFRDDAGDLRTSVFVWTRRG